MTMAVSGSSIAKILAMKLKNLILCILNLFKRALCIFRRRTPHSPVLPVVVSDAKDVAVYDIPDVVDNDAASWDTWDSAQDFQGPTTTNSISASHSSFETQAVTQLLPQDHPPVAIGDDSEQEPDYFADMTPATFKAPKIVVKKKSPYSASSLDAGAAGGGVDSAAPYSSRLAVADNASDGLALAPPQELEAMDDWDNPMVEENMWADEENEELDWEVEFALRETRRQELERKKWEQQQRRLQREMQKTRTNSQSSSSHFQTIQSLSH